MNYREMFSSKFLRVEDIDQTRKTPATIAAIRPMQATAAAQTQQPAGFGAVPGASAPPDVLWGMYFREHPKPIKFKPYHAEAVFASLSEADPSKWIGRQVYLYAGTVMFANTSYQKVLISPEPVLGQTLPPANATLALPQAPMDKRPLGIKNADAFKAALAEQGATVDEYLAWLKKQPTSPDHDAYAATHGRELADWPRGAAPLMQAFLRDYKAKAADQAALDADEDIPF